MAETATIALGGREFVIRPLTFRQLRDIEAALDHALKAGAQTRINFDAAIDILAAALGRGDPALNRDAILDLEGKKARSSPRPAVLRLSGYVDGGDAAPGEAQAGD